MRWGLAERVSNISSSTFACGRQRSFLTQANRHSDLGSLTLLFYQPIGGLQVLARDGSWKDVRMVPGTLTVNLADALHFLTSEYTTSKFQLRFNLQMC